MNSDLYRVSHNQLEKLECEVYPGTLSKGIDFLRMGQCEDDIESFPERELISQAGGSLKGPWYTQTKMRKITKNVPKQGCFRPANSAMALIRNTTMNISQCLLAAV